MSFPVRKKWCEIFQQRGPFKGGQGQGRWGKRMITKSIKGKISELSKIQP